MAERRKKRVRRRVVRRRRAMVRTKVTIDLPERPLAYSDAIFRVYRGRYKLGEVRVSQGGLDWRGRSGKKWRRFSWSRLAAVLEGE